MAINPLDVIGNQVKSAARNQVRTAQAEFRRETSIVGYANARIGAAAQRVERARKKQAPKRAKAGVYVQEHPAILAPDGYVRRSPVQPLRVAPDYYKRLARRIIGGVVAVAILAGIAVLLIQYLL